jgi:uroporphyrinogen decarboxylase
MISRDRVIRTLNRQPIDHAPRDLWLPPGTEAARPDDVAEINVRFPADVLHLETNPHPSKRSKPHSAAAAMYTDPWGCAWKADSPDHAPVLAGSPLADAAALAAFHPPGELLQATRYAKINGQCAGTGKFTLATSELRPLERLCQLRGPETALRELGEGNVGVRDLLARLHDFARREAELWGKTDVDGVILGDDLSWAMQSHGNLKLWRAIVMPLFCECCSILHAHDKFVFFHARGPTAEMIEDFVAMGVDALHAQWPLEEFVRLAAAWRRRIVFWGGVENRLIEPPSQPDQVREAVHCVRKAADFGAGGIISQVSWTKSVPLRNIATFFEQWLVPLPVVV